MGSRVITALSGGISSASYSAETFSGTVTSAKFDNIVTAINTEYVRRRQTNPAFASRTGVITAASINTLLSGLNNLSGQSASGNSLGNPGVDASASTISDVNISAAFAGYSDTGTFSGASGKVTASSVADFSTLIYNAGQQCLCNCNYCTCNCNYCTCNCDYSCTCNCNYSDQRLKENITLIDTEGDVNVYSYTYLWDKTKTFVGVLAQELLGTKYESALGKDSNGYYYVDYSQLPVTFREV